MTVSFVCMRNLLQVWTSNEDKKGNSGKLQSHMIFLFHKLSVNLAWYSRHPDTTRVAVFTAVCRKRFHQGTISPLHANERLFPSILCSYERKKRWHFCSSFKILFSPKPGSVLKYYSTFMVHCEKKAISGALCLICCSVDCVLTSRNFLGNNSDRAKWSPVLR